MLQGLGKIYFFIDDYGETGEECSSSNNTGLVAPGSLPNKFNKITGLV